MILKIRPHIWSLKAQDVEIDIKHIKAVVTPYSDVHVCGVLLTGKRWARRVRNFSQPALLMELAPLHMIHIDEYTWVAPRAIEGVYRHGSSLSIQFKDGTRICHGWSAEELKRSFRHVGMKLQIQSL